MSCFVSNDNDANRTKQQFMISTKKLVYMYKSNLQDVAAVNW